MPSKQFVVYLRKTIDGEVRVTAEELEDAIALVACNPAFYEKQADWHEEDATIKYVGADEDE